MMARRPFINIKAAILMLIKDLFLAPIYLYQGSKIKRQTVRLPEATGDRHGQLVLNEKATSPRTLTLMMVGDSSAAGVGVETQNQALTGHLLASLRTAGFMRRRFDQVHWSLQATTGYTSFDVLRQLYVMARPASPVDVMIVIVGVNDTTSNIKPQQWQTQIEEIIAVGRRKFGVKHMLFSCLPPMAQMPALPTPLADFVGAKALALDEILKQICERHRDVSYLYVDFSEAGLGVEKMFASDGFHPNATAYAYWAKKIVRRMEKITSTKSQSSL